MKKILFYVCTFVFVSFTVDSKKLGSANKHYNTCLTETNVSEDDMITVQDILHDRYKSENQEKLNKNGCVVQCMFQKDEMMEDAEYKVEKIHTVFIERTNIQPGDKKFERMENCINKTKDLTEKCEKAFLLCVCVLSEHMHDYGYNESAK
ncbi:PREDICTED: pheromone-binding protein Gp-9-like [Trachymyrmex cornetzi]|uniref:pheromone-binding protein Gp-9-like n=1 Tax=Trachymyrmex cornetzi TaxID=471704 RepID=UPI00084F3432|nr:PREDICTED: pheromone-binding protein Gp-9-like [Trachymyrmex cornetzi]